MYNIALLQFFWKPDLTTSHIFYIKCKFSQEIQNQPVWFRKTGGKYLLQKIVYDNIYTAYFSLTGEMLHVLHMDKLVLERLIQ